MAEPVGVALIGVGMWGKRLAAAVRRTPSLQLVTIYRRDAAQREAFSAEFGCESADSFEAAIDHPKVQAVLLVTPNHLHKSGTLDCAERGKHVFVEKPIADTLDDGRDMRLACQKAGVTLFVGHCFRRLGAARKVKQLLQEEALGRVILAEANFSLPGRLTPDKWRYYRQTCPAGPLLQLGIHHADTLQYWLGPVQHVQGSFARLSTPAEIDDVGLALLEFKGGTRAALSSSYVSPHTFYLRLYGTKGNLDYQTDMSIWPNAERMDAATRLTLQSKSSRQSIPFDNKDMLVEELDEFARCVRGETTPETGPDEGLAALQVILATLAAHESGQVYTLV
ncbi:MAG: Gfo/Idh/MocA family oxidoreductase [Anaerolineales bacterium]